MLRLPRRSTLFPYTTLFRSLLDQPLVDDAARVVAVVQRRQAADRHVDHVDVRLLRHVDHPFDERVARAARDEEDRKSTRLNSSHSQISYAVFCLKKKNLIQSNNRRTSLKVEKTEGRVTLLDDLHFDFAFLQVTGPGDINFTDADFHRLRD